MIILDTSIWIEFFRRNIDFKSSIDQLLKTRKIIALDLIFGELLQGAKEYEKDKIAGMWQLLPKFQNPQLAFNAGLYSFENGLYKKGIGLIDSAIICATIESDSKLWTLDKKIVNVMDKKYLI